MFKLNILCFVICVTSVFCRPEIKLDSRIVGGSTAPTAQYPYQVSLRTTSNYHFCGASIISVEWILTAAHCTYNVIAQNIIAVVGTNRLSSGGTTYNIASITCYGGCGNFNTTTFMNDISLLQVEGTIVISPIEIEILGVIILQTTVDTVPLASNVTTPGGTRAVVTGWGVTNVSLDVIQKCSLCS